MKIKWGVEGICNYAQCGSLDRIVEIPDDELEGLDEAQRENLIDDWVGDEFRQNVTYYWSIQGTK